MAGKDKLRIDGGEFAMHIGVALMSGILAAMPISKIAGLTSHPALAWDWIGAILLSVLTVLLIWSLLTRYKL